MQTAKQTSKIKLSADRSTIKADGQDLSYITVELTDANGIRNPKAENLLKFKIEGGTIAGVGNANPVSLESYQLPQRKAWQGRCLVIVRSSRTNRQNHSNCFSEWFTFIKTDHFKSRYKITFHEKKSIPATYFFLLVCFCFNCTMVQDTVANNRIRDFDSDWQFVRDSIAGAEQPGFDDSKWRVLDLPHDWSIEDLPEQIPGKTIGPFSKESEGALNGGFNRSCCWRHGMVSQNIYS